MYFSDQPTILMTNGFFVVETGLISSSCMNTELVITQRKTELKRTAMPGTPAFSRKGKIRDGTNCTIESMKACAAWNRTSTGKVGALAT